MKKALSFGLLSAGLTMVFCGGKAVTADGTDAGSIHADSGSTYDDLRKCEVDKDCRVAAPGCCGINCTSSSSLIAIRADQVATLQKQTCTGDVACPACVSVPDANIAAICRAKLCTLIDLRTDVLSECTNDADCEVADSACCANCSPNSQSIAFRKDAAAEITSLACGGEVPPCPYCKPKSNPPTATCSPSHHCQVTPPPV